MSEIKLSLADPKPFKEAFFVASELINECHLRITQDGVKLTALDPANVAMINLMVKKNGFTEFLVPEDTTIGVNLTSLKQILKRIQQSDILQIRTNGKDKLYVGSLGTTKKEFTLPLIDIDGKEATLPKMDYKAKVETDAAFIAESVIDAEIVGESVTFSVMGQNFSMDAQGDKSSAQATLPLVSTIVKLAEGITRVKSKYSVEYLKKLVEGRKISDKVTIHFGEDYPLKMDFVNEYVSLEFILAPRVGE